MYAWPRVIRLTMQRCIKTHEPNVHSYISLLTNVNLYLLLSMTTFETLSRELTIELTTYRTWTDTTKARLTEWEKQSGSIHPDTLRAQEAEIKAMLTRLNQIEERLASAPFQEAVKQLSRLAWKEIIIEGTIGTLIGTFLGPMVTIPHTNQQEIREVKRIKKEIKDLLSQNKILSERFCKHLQDIQELIKEGLQENKKALKVEKKEKQQIAEEIRKREEVELLQAKKNAAW